MADTPWWQNLEAGTLVDSQIIELAEAGRLITSNFDKERVKQACYELRASSILYETASTRENKRIEVQPNHGYVLRPHCYVTIIVMEKIGLPANVVARVLTKGQLFSVGILPVNTYADPGFDGRLGISIYNGSHRYLIIKPGQPIAKIEFNVLPQPVERPYDGQHGFETEIWPIPTHLYASADALKQQGIIRDSQTELRRIYGEPIAEVFWRLNYFTIVAIGQMVVMLLILLIILWMKDKVSLAEALLVGVSSNVLTSIGAHIGSRVLWRRMRQE